MSDTFRLKMARQQAEKLLRDDDVKTLPVDPFVIAARRDIVVEAKPDTAKGVSGMLLRHGNNFGILYATHIPNEGFQRFSISHELGHYFLDGHIDHVLPNDGFHASHAGFVSGDPYELEADHFAAGLLMPTDLFKRALNKVSIGLSAVEAMADICHTSLTATAIRYAQLTNHAVAVIISTGQLVDYCFLSEEMNSLPELEWLRKGSSIPGASATARISADSGRVLRAERADNEIDVMQWLGGERSMTVTEEVIGLGRYGKTLTVLSSETIRSNGNSDEDEADEEDLIESWTPRFRR
jgi:Zn-dependent peptidase ImmA (M78 family)